MSFGRPMLPPVEASLVDILRDRTQATPERAIFSFLEDGEHESAWLTYSQLERSARAIAAELQVSTIPGDRALLVYPPGLDFISALFGCFYAGVIAVPVCPPRMELSVDPYRPLLGIIRDCEPVAVLAGSHYADSMRLLVQTLAGQSPVRVIATEQIELGKAEEWQPSSISRDTVALLQYTSGSTGDPKGVMISHGNILSNEFVIQLATQHRTAIKMGGGVCWLPLYHDMGLFGSILQAVYVDGLCRLMSPLVLLQHPVRWLQAISQYRAHTSGGPNFAYELCVRRVTEEEKSTLDLSCWEVAPIGAEPISMEVMDRFAEAFGRCGFRREAFYPGYGLAEATLCVTGGHKEALPIARSFPANEIAFREPGQEADETAASDPRVLVGCGRTWTDHELLIVDPSTQQVCREGVVGEIWFRGPSVAQGYWRREAETEATFRGFLSGSGDGPYLRTGDLGFLCEGELYVSGRLKDLIVIRGRNHYPQDIEETVAGLHEAFRPNSTAAIGCLVDATEQLVILQEIDRLSRKLDLERLSREIRSAIGELHHLQVYDIVFLRKNSLPKTTSGKIRRNASRERYLSGRLSLWTGAATT